MVKLDKTYTLQELRDLFGPECSGKTIIGVQVVQEALKNGGAIFILDREHSLDPKLLEELGVTSQSKADET